MREKKTISFVMIQFLIISTSLMVLSPIELASAGVSFSLPDSTIPSNSLNLDSSAEVFLNTKWAEPLTPEQVNIIESESMDDLYSEPDSHACTILSQVSDSSNETDFRSQTYSSDEVAIEDITTESLEDSGWPWQPWPWIRDDFPALTPAPSMEGRWWSKRSYSTLSFDIQIDTPIEDELYIWAWIIRDQDSYSRYLTFWFDNNLVQQYIIGSAGFKSSVHVPSSMINTGLTRHRVELSINYCGYVDRAWKLLYGWVGEGAGANGYQQTPPLDNNGNPYSMSEMTPRTGQTHCVMEFDVLAGEYTLLNIQTENIADSTSRTIKVYFENSGGTYDYKGMLTSPGSYQVYLGEHTDNVHRKLKLEFRYMPDIDYAKRITQLCVTHIGSKFEIDYMPNTQVNILVSQIGQMNAYYKTHSYHYVTYTTSDDLPYDIATTLSEHETYWNTYFDYKNQAKWEYVIYVPNLLHDGKYYSGWHHAPPIRIYDYGIAVANSYNYMPHVIWHEYGHHIYISCDLLGENYCSNPGCVMTQGVSTYGRYCFYHFWQRHTF